MIVVRDEALFSIYGGLQTYTNKYSRYPIAWRTRSEVKCYTADTIKLKLERALRGLL